MPGRCDAPRSCMTLPCSLWAVRQAWALRLGHSVMLFLTATFWWTTAVQAAFLEPENGIYGRLIAPNFLCGRELWAITDTQTPTSESFCHRAVRSVLIKFIDVQRRELRQLAICAAVKGCWWGIGRKSATLCRQEGALPLLANPPRTQPMELRYALNLQNRQSCIMLHARNSKKWTTSLENKNSQLQAGMCCKQVGSSQQPLERKDWQRKHVCNGRDIILRHEEPNSDSAPAPGLASISQLTYSMRPALLRKNS